MKNNVGRIDRLLRLIAALALFNLYFLLEGDLRYLALIGLVPLMTALIRFCPAYCIIGVNTNANACQDSDTKDNKDKGNNDSLCCGGCGGEGHDEKSKD